MIRVYCIICKQVVDTYEECPYGRNTFIFCKKCRTRIGFTI